MNAKNNLVLLPKSKISMTILEFAEPLFAHFPEIPPIDALRNLLKIVITVWNAHTLAMPIWGEPQHLDNLNEVLGGPAPPLWTAAAVAALTDRRHERFGDDPRAVGEWAIEPDGDGFVFRCDARLPDSVLPRDSKRPRGRSRRSSTDASASRSDGSAPPKANRPR